MLINTQTIKKGNGSYSVDARQVSDKVDCPLWSPAITTQVLDYEWSNFQEVEYIEGTGTQYIDTGYYPSSDTMLQAKFVYSVSGGNAFLGYWYLSESDDYRLFTASGKTYWDCGSGDGRARISGSYISSTSAIYEAEFGNRYVKDIPTDTVKFSSSAVTFAQKAKTINVFCSTDYGKIYYLKIYENGTLVRNFVPCYHKTEGVIGLYDRVNSMFYTNAGTGTFLKGADVNEVN